MPRFPVLIQELPKPRDASEPALVSSPVRTLDVEVEAESWEEAVARGWEEWDARYKGQRPEAGRFRVLRPPSDTHG
jgi:hypothetical protein